jgi:hypothetical protein
MLMKVYSAANEMSWWLLIVIGLVAGSMVSVVLLRLSPSRMQTLHASCAGALLGIEQASRWLHGAAVIAIALISIDHDRSHIRPARRWPVDLSWRALAALSTRLRLELGKAILDILDTRRCETGDPTIGRDVEKFIVEQELRSIEANQSGGAREV